MPPATLTGSVRGDLVLLDPLLGVGEVAISDHRSSQPTFDEILRLAADAHVAGLMTGKAGVLHLHLGDGPRGLDLVRRALSESEIPAARLQPDPRQPPQGAVRRGARAGAGRVPVDLTAFPVEDGEDAWSAAEGLQRYLASGAPPERVTVSSDAGGCLPCFDADGRVCRMDVGSAGRAARRRCGTCWPAACRWRRSCPPSQPTRPGCCGSPGKGRIAAGADADLVALDATGGAHTVISAAQIHVRDGKAVRRGTFET